MQIEGTIKYKVELNDKGETVLEYESTLENDIAAMAIAEYVCSEWINHIKEEKSNHTGKVRAQINDRLNRTLQVKSGLKTLTDYAFAMYKVFKGLGASTDVKEENSEFEKLEPFTHQSTDEIKLESIQIGNENNNNENLTNL